MGHLILRHVPLLVILSIIFNNIKSQNLYDYEHSSRFAQFLTVSGQYTTAANEWERVVYMDSTNAEAKYQLLRTYSLIPNYKIGIKRTKSLFPDSARMPRKIGLTYLKMLINDHNYNAPSLFMLQYDSISNTEKEYILMNIYIFDSKWESARKIYTKYDTLKSYTPYAHVFSQINKYHNKSLVLSGLLSGIVPGSGRFYTGEWKDGLISLIFVSSFVYESYRGFVTKGSHSGLGYIYGTFGLGFYLSNIYGSVKSAQRVNQHHKKQIIDPAYNIFNTSL